MRSAEQHPSVTRSLARPTADTQTQSGGSLLQHLSVAPPPECGRQMPECRGSGGREEGGIDRKALKIRRRQVEGRRAGKQGAGTSRRRWRGLNGSVFLRSPTVTMPRLAVQQANRLYPALYHSLSGERTRGLPQSFSVPDLTPGDGAGADQVIITTTTKQPIIIPRRAAWRFQCRAA